MKVRSNWRAPLTRRHVNVFLSWTSCCVQGRVLRCRCQTTGTHYEFSLDSTSRSLQGRTRAGPAYPRSRRGHATDPGPVGCRSFCDGLDLKRGLSTSCFGCTAFGSALDLTAVTACKILQKVRHLSKASYGMHGASWAFNFRIRMPS